VTQGQPQEQSSSAPVQAGLALGVVALAGGLPDPWLPVRWRRFAALVRAERRVYDAMAGFFSRWIAGVRPRVVLPGGAVNPVGVYAARHAFTLGTDEILDVQVRKIYESAWHEVMLAAPVPPSNVETYLAGARNRLVGVPESVYSQVKAEVLKAHTQGWSIAELSGKVDQIFTEEGAARWRNRSLVIARTEAIGAYNAGTYAGFLAYAAQAGGEWEKGWLATHDSRVRPTHIAADLTTLGTGQRVPLTEQFKVGTALLDFPGDPSGPPEEVIQCRCSQVLLRPGEAIDMSHRHKGNP
jgi:hypothetical protein